MISLWRSEKIKGLWVINCEMVTRKYMGEFWRVRIILIGLFVKVHFGTDSQFQVIIMFFCFQYRKGLGNFTTCF